MKIKEMKCVLIKKHETISRVKNSVVSICYIPRIPTTYTVDKRKLRLWCDNR